MDFYSDEREVLGRMGTLKALVAEQEVHNEPCTLLLNQLRDLEVLTSKLLLYVREVQRITAKRVKGG